MKALILIEVEGGMVSDVHRVGEVEYHVVDWDVTEMGDEIDELPAEFATEWPEIAKAVQDTNAELDD